MKYETYQKGNYQVIKINEVLNLVSDISDLEKEVNDLLEKKIVTIALHFKEGSYLYSSTGSVLVRCWETIKDNNGKMALVNINQDILDFLRVIDFESAIEIFNSEEELSEGNE